MDIKYTFCCIIISGAAVSILILTYIRCILHGLELSYALYFCFASMQSPLPWSSPSNANETAKYEYFLIAVTLLYNIFDFFRIFLEWKYAFIRPEFTPGKHIIPFQLRD